MQHIRFDVPTRIIGLGFSLWLAAAPLVADDRAAFFETRIRPVLMGTCFTCHGGDKTASGLRVDALRHLTHEGEYGVAIVPGKPEESMLLNAIRYAGRDLKMPPKERLPDRVISDFEKWIADGAIWPAATPQVDADSGLHWAFQPIERGSEDPPAESTIPHPIDRFLGVGHRQRGLRPLGPTGRHTLIRRASFDLTGLPPTPDQIQAFLDDERPDAFVHAVDRLLESPRYAAPLARFGPLRRHGG